jgi:hypothetical protein
MVAPQSHSGLSLNFHLCISSLHLPCPVRILLNLTQVFLGRFMPKTVVRTISIWIPPGLSCCHSAYHTLGVFSLISVMIRALNKNDFQDLSLRFIIPSSCIGNSWYLSIVSFSFSTLFCFLMYGFYAGQVG